MIFKEAFLALDINDRAKFVWQRGEFIDYREYYGYKIALYSLPKLFVEVWVFEATGKIEKVEVVEDSNTLAQYVNSKELINLFNSN